MGCFGAYAGCCEGMIGGVTMPLGVMSGAIFWTEGMVVKLGWKLGWNGSLKVWCLGRTRSRHDAMDRHSKLGWDLGAPFLFSFFGLDEDGEKGRITIHEATSHDE